MNIAFIFLKPFFNLINLRSLRRQKKLKFNHFNSTIKSNRC